MTMTGTAHSFRAILLVLACAPLLPGPAAGQQPTAVPVPSLQGLDDERTRHLEAREGFSLTVAALPAASELRPVHAPIPGLSGPADDARDDAPESLGGLGDVLPRQLSRDIVELRDRIRRYRTVLFGHRGILRWGHLEGDDRTGRVRLNLQADPHPGVRVTLVTR